MKALRHTACDALYQLDRQLIEDGETLAVHLTADAYVHAPRPAPGPENLERPVLLRHQAE